MNVCTHSYSLVWYDWAAWERFIDWMALSGINFALAMTGQEEVQYKVMTALGVSDLDMRNWTNGPAFLTWSRGQNGHGNGIAGPLPRSFMQSQWALQRQILQRFRDLGIMGHLPAFQGNAPWALAVAQGDTENATRAGDTAWIDARDPLFTKVADAWAAQIVADFGPVTHAWQMDAYFGNGTSWGAEEAVEALKDRETVRALVAYTRDAQPAATRVLLDERDDILARALRSAGGSRVVGVVGLAHVDGIEQRWAAMDAGGDVKQSRTDARLKS
jgi:hypothetical protein